MSKPSPMMKQYMEIKREHPHALLFYRLGDFYELFFEDAVTASEELGLTLTGRDMGMEERAPMCGVPHHSAEGYIARLVKLGYKVAVCEQAESPDTERTREIIAREVIKVITPGTTFDDSVLEAEKNNYIAAVREEKNRTGIAFADITTGDFYAYSIQGAAGLLDELSRLSPREILLQEGSELAGFGETITSYLPSEFFTTEGAKGAEECLLKYFKLKTLESFGIDDDSAAICAAGALLSYLISTQKNSLPHLNALKPYKSSEYLAIDTASRRNLELTETIRAGGKNAGRTLLSVIDDTKTKMGARTLRRWLLEPLTAINKIETRLAAVSELKSKAQARENIRTHLSEVADIERIIGRLASGTLKPEGLAALKHSLGQIPLIINLLSPFVGLFLTYLREETDPLSDIYEFLNRAVADKPGAGPIKTGFNEELDKYYLEKKDAEGVIEQLEKEERLKTGIKGLSIRRNKVYGSFIEVTNSHLPIVPKEYVRIQTLLSGERFIIPALKEAEARLLDADEKIAALETALRKEITAKILGNAARIKGSAFQLSAVDALQSLAEVAHKNNYVRPAINDKGLINIKGGRHPVVERLAGDDFRSNDTYANTDTDRFFIITGPNMAGKSTYMRQAALIVILAQMGSFVPALSADIGICDKLFTRVGAFDDLSAGLSTFMAEMTEVAGILRNATRDSLIILDEVGRGTSTFDGMAIAWAVLEYIAGLGARTLFATHYHELTEISKHIPGVINYNARVDEADGRVSFLYKIEKGAAGSSYGIHVAKLAGLPAEVTDRADALFGKLALKEKEISILIDENIDSKVFYGKN